MEHVFVNQFWGLHDNGFPVAQTRIKNSLSTLEELLHFYKHRIAIEKEYNKKLEKLNASAVLGSGETGTLKIALEKLQIETQNMVDVNHKFSRSVTLQNYEKLHNFYQIYSRTTSKIESHMQKVLARKRESLLHLQTTKEKYRTECLQIKSLLLMCQTTWGKELDRNTSKLNKAKLGIDTLKYQYQEAIERYRDIHEIWVRDWAIALLNLYQLEIERIQMCKLNCFSYCNNIASLCLDLDHCADAARGSFAKVSAPKDIYDFAGVYGTGDKIPGVPEYVDFMNGDDENAPEYNEANFKDPDYSQILTRTFSVQSGTTPMKLTSPLRGPTISSGVSGSAYLRPCSVSPTRNSPTRNSPTRNSPTRNSPTRNSPTRNSPDRTNQIDYRDSPSPVRGLIDRRNDEASPNAVPRADSTHISGQIMPGSPTPRTKALPPIRELLLTQLPPKFDLGLLSPGTRQKVQLEPLTRQLSPTKVNNTRLQKVPSRNSAYTSGPEDRGDVFDDRANIANSNGLLEYLNPTNYSGCVAPLNIRKPDAGTVKSNGSGRSWSSPRKKDHLVREVQDQINRRLRDMTEMFTGYNPSHTPYETPKTHVPIAKDFSIDFMAKALEDLNAGGDGDVTQFRRSVRNASTMDGLALPSLDFVNDANEVAVRHDARQEKETVRKDTISFRKPRPKSMGDAANYQEEHLTETIVRNDKRRLLLQSPTKSYTNLNSLLEKVTPVTRNKYVTRAVAKYTYNARENGELSFRRGWHMYVIHKQEDNWYVCELGENCGSARGKVGLVPYNYVAEGDLVF